MNGLDGPLERLDYQDVENRIGRFFGRENRPFSDLGESVDHGLGLLDCFTWNNCRRAGRIVERDYCRPDHLAESAVILKHAWSNFDGCAFRTCGGPGQEARINAVDRRALAAAATVSGLLTAAAICRAWVAVPVIVPVIVAVIVAAVAVAVAAVASLVALVAVAAASIVAAASLFSIDRSYHDHDRHDQGQGED